MANNINEFTIEGRVVRDAEKRQAGNYNITEFSVACEEAKKKGNEWENYTNFFEVKSWSEIDLHKGDDVVIIGKLKQERWQDKNSGQTRSKVILQAKKVLKILRAPKLNQPQTQAQNVQTAFDGQVVNKQPQQQQFYDDVPF